MKRFVEVNTKINENATQDMGIILSNWERRTKKYKRYRFSLQLMLLISVGTLLGYGYFWIDSSIPSVLRIRADAEQVFDLGIPAKASVKSVSRLPESNIPQGAVTIDLSKSVKWKAGSEREYSAEVRLFGFLPFKEMGIQVMQDEELIPVGAPIGIYVKTDGIMVIGTGEFTGEDGKKYSPSKSLLKSGDYIHKLNGETVLDKESFMKTIEEGNGDPVTLTVERNKKMQEVQIQPVLNQSGILKLGVWIRDNTQGVGTMTYIDAEGNFGALGHGITDVDTNTLMDIEDGTLYQTQIVSIEKGAAGHPGELVGMIVYSDDNILGDIQINCEKGIFGNCDKSAFDLTGQAPLPIGLKQEIEKGPAQILCTVDGYTRYYDIEITAVHMDHDNVNRGLELKITDPTLIALTGGIVQGMSGAPIIQNNKLIGAITHVLVQDSTKGYGIFIENMLEH